MIFIKSADCAHLQWHQRTWTFSASSSNQARHLPSLPVPGMGPALVAAGGPAGPPSPGRGGGARGRLPSAHLGPPEPAVKAPLTPRCPSSFLPCPSGPVQAELPVPVPPPAECKYPRVPGGFSILSLTPRVPPLLPFHPSASRGRVRPSPLPEQPPLPQPPVLAPPPRSRPAARRLALATAPQSETFSLLLPKALAFHLRNFSAPGWCQRLEIFPRQPAVNRARNGVGHPPSSWKRLSCMKLLWIQKMM